MATIQTAQFGNNYCPQAQLDVVASSSTGGDVTYTWTLSWVTHGYTVTSSASKAYTAKIDGVTVAEGSFAIGGKSTTTIASGTYTIAKGTSERSVPIDLSFAMTFTWHGKSGSTKTASGSFTIPAKDSYTISYNLNGGYGSFASQLKWYGESITLHGHSPSRDGHTFLGWSTSSDSSVEYYPNGTYSANENVTLYAVWSIHTYIVSYDANGGDNAPASQTKVYGVDLQLQTAIPTRTNYNFLGWATSASGGVVYVAGANYSNNGPVTLYAVWQLAYWKPNIYNFSAYRCDSAGNASETGTYIKCVFSWASYYSMAHMYIDWTVGTDWSAQTSERVSASGTSGTVSQIVGNGNINIETTYSVRVSANDNAGMSYSPELSVGTVKFPIDVKAGGTGVAIGKVSEKDAFEVGMTMFDRLGDFEVLSPLRYGLGTRCKLVNGNWNDACGTDSGFYMGMGLENSPAEYLSGANWFYVIHLVHDEHFQSQIAKSFFSDELWVRRKQSDTWTPWLIINNNNYSQDERVIGTWVNGKPIYRLVVFTTETQYNYSWLNIEDIIDLKVNAKFGDVFFNTGRYTKNAGDAGDLFTWFHNTTNKIIYIDIGSTWTAGYELATIIIEYTKTTD